MISFIVIGKNESFKLVLCLRAIYKFAEVNEIKNFEVIYVDSNSTDKSVEKVLSEFQNVRVFVRKAPSNAACGRNIGAKEAKGDIYFFIDGDMELLPNRYWSKLSNKVHGYILSSGQLQNYWYASSFSEVLRKDLYYSQLTEPRLEIFFGGIFVIEKALWEKAGEMRTEFVYGEDIDLSIRLSAMGYKLLRYPAILAIHHTAEKKIGLKQFIKNAAYSRGVLYRKNFFNPYIINRILRSDPTAPLLALAIIFTSYTSNFVPMYLYGIIVLIALVVNLKFNISVLLSRLWQQPFRDLAVIVTFILFHPNKPPKNLYYSPRS